jgi:hypothetical protein
MAKIKVSSITKGNSVSSAAQCPPPAPKPEIVPKPEPEPVEKGPVPPPPPPFFKPGPCCCTSQIVDNITVLSTTPETLDVVEGTYLGMKAFGVGTKTFEGVGTSGVVPTPTEDDADKVLRGDGTWYELPAQVQSDWDEEDVESPAFILHKPEEYKGDGKMGFVPPASLDNPDERGFFLRGDAKWINIRACSVDEMTDWINEAESELEVANG